MMLSPYLTQHTKINPKWVKGLNSRAKALKLFKEITGDTPCVLGFSNGFFNVTPKALGTR
jgi:hypothetical protein